MLDIQLLVAQMTLEEKAALCTGATAWTTTPVARLGVPELYVSDGPHGVRRVADANSMAIEATASTCFPTASCVAASWDADLCRRMGEALAEEAIALDVDVLLGPGINMKRTPVCGRNFEYFAEDPFLAGKLAAGLIAGIQGKGVGTSLKHFAANNQEHERMTISAEVDERTLREIYLPAFEIAVKEAQPWTVMCAYNRLNGIYGSENHELLVDILKEEWGFEGFVVSDWGAVHDRVAALQGGLDLEMPGPRARRVREVVAAVRSGRLAASVLDDAAGRILRIVCKAAETPKGAPFAAAEHHALARTIAAEGMVLLKNDGTLPLQGALKDSGRIAVIGRAAQEPHFQGHGSSHINPTQVDVPFAELEKLAGGAQLSYSEGYPADDSSRPDLIAAAVAAARAADVALLYIALPTFKESEGYDRADLDLTDHQVALIQAVTAVQPRSVVILNNGSAVTMSAWIDGAAAVLEAWMMGQAGGGAIADILFGVVNPSGKLAETFPLRLADTPAYLNHPGEYGSVAYGERLLIGYRYYDAADRPVLFPFGYGQSYTTFAYSAPQRVGQDLSRRRRRDRVGRRHQHGIGGGQRDRADIRPRSRREPGAAAQGTQGIRQGRAAAGRDQDRDHPAGFPGLCLLPPGLRAVDHGGRRVRHPDRRVVGRYPLRGDGDAAVDAGPAFAPDADVHPTPVAGRQARQRGLCPLLPAGAGHACRHLCARPRDGRS